MPDEDPTPDTNIRWPDLMFRFQLISGRGASSVEIPFKLQGS